MSGWHHALLLGVITFLLIRLSKATGDRFYIGLSVFWGALFVIRTAQAVVGAMQ